MKINEYLDKEVGKPIYNHIKSGGRSAHYYDSLPVDGSLLRLFMYYITFVAPDNEKRDFRKYIEGDNVLKHWIHFEYFNGRTIIRVGDDRKDGVGDNESVYNNTHVRNGIFRKLWAHCPANVFDNFLEYSRSKEALGKISSVSDFHGDRLVPSNVVLGLPEVAKPQWLIHLTPTLQNALEIAKNGFKRGLNTSQMDKMAYTYDVPSDEKENGKFSYAFSVEDINGGNINGDYPSKMFNKAMDAKVWNHAMHYAVMFKASGVRFNHYTDRENQVAFRNDSARDFVVLAYSRSNNDDEYDERNTRNAHYGIMWNVLTRNALNDKTSQNETELIKNNTIYQNSSLTEVINWVVNNGGQYAKKIMRRKGDKIRENRKKIHITEKQENLLVNESIKVHKGEKGKECSTQGKWADSINCPHCGEKAFFSMSLSDGDKGRGRIKVHDENGKEIDSEVQTIALYYCPNCYRFTAHNNMA